LLLKHFLNLPRKSSGILRSENTKIYKKKVAKGVEEKTFCSPYMFLAKAKTGWREPTTGAERGDDGNPRGPSEARPLGPSEARP